MFGLLILAQLLYVISLLGRNSPVEEVLLQGVGFGVPPTVATILAIWRFNVWRWRTPNALRDLWEHKRLALPDGDADRSYLCLLERYRAALASPKRYLLSGFSMIFICIPFVYEFAQALSSEPPLIESVGGLLYTFLFLGGFYCIGILVWAMYISGWYVRKLARAFQLSIRPFHPDQSGGLKLLGNFCFGLASPLLLASGLFIGYSMFALVEYSPINGSAYLVLNVYYPLFFVLLFALPTIVLGFMLPLRDIHTKMVSEAKTNQTSYFTRTEALREEIQALLDVKQIEAAKAVHEEMTLIEALYVPYPVWPFHVRSKISSTVLEVSGSLLIGLITAALVQYFFPAILTLLFHTP
jgi:hypothetical protein